ncbi:hypothetical protein HY605_00210 [Candidatus Peregrinibacteria bacterium]|nr:hypothetical protein [Candidatus Peregrinibacteria bacterium]
MRYNIGMAIIDRRTGITYGIFNPLQKQVGYDLKGLQGSKMYPKRSGYARTSAQEADNEIFKILTARYSNLSEEIKNKWEIWAHKNSDAAFLIEKEMCVGRHWMARRKARHKIDGCSAYVMCNKPAVYAGLPISDTPPILWDPTTPPTGLKLEYIRDEKYPAGAISPSFTDPLEVKEGTTKIYRARLFLGFSNDIQQIISQFAGYIELPFKSPVIVDKIRGVRHLRDKMVGFDQIGKGYLYAILDAVAKDKERAALPSRLYSNVARVYINKDPEGIVKSDKKMAEYLSKHPPKRLG